MRRCLGVSDSPTGSAADASPTGASPTDVARLARPTSPRWLLRGLDVVKGLVLGTVVTIGAAAHVQADPVTPSVTAPGVSVDHELQRLMAHERCTTTGLPDGAIPARTLIRLPDGHLTAVSFDRGWAAHEGTAPGELVAVCQGARHQRR